MALGGARPHRTTHRATEPPVQILSYRYAYSIKQEPAIPVGHSLRELLRDRRPRLAVDVAILGTLAVYTVYCPTQRPSLRR
jgi:hypothetical protein